MDDPTNATTNLPGRRPLRRGLMLSVLFPAGAWVMSGRLGLVASVVMVILWGVFALRTTLLWLAAAVLVAISPILLIAQGLPTGAVVGSGFGSNHLLAHRAVILALLFGAFAATVEVSGLEEWPRAGLATRWRRHRVSPAASGSVASESDQPARP